MLNIVGVRTPPCGLPVLNWRCVVCVVSEFSVGRACFDVVCDAFDNGLQDACLMYVDCIECYAHVWFVMLVCFG